LAAELNLLVSERYGRACYTCASDMRFAAAAGSLIEFVRKSDAQPTSTKANALDFAHGLVARA